MINQLRDRTRRTATLTAVAAAAALTAALLAGCTGTPEATPQPTTEVSTSASAPASNTPASSAPASTATSKSDDGGSDGKPSKDEVITGLVEFYTSSQGMAKAQATKFATCMVDEMYDKASAKTLQAMQDGKAENIDPDDASLFATAGVACAKKAV